MKTITRNAYAKVNLGLDVLGRREDGYHIVKMIMQTVDLYDTLTYTVTEDGSVGMTTDCADIPDNGDNLVIKAIQLMRTTYKIPQGVSVHLSKRIPVAAGMAGGSTDAASAFLAMKELFDLPVSMEELKAMAVTLGADIPYCLEGGTRLSEGIGEKLTVLPDAPETALVIVKPALFVSTGWVYQTLDALEHVTHPDIDGMVEAIEQQDVNRIAALSGNVLEQVTGAKYEIIGELEAFLEENGAIKALMTGSGPTVFAYFSSKEAASKAYEQLASVKAYEKLQMFVSRFVPSL